ncbi:MAG: DUF5777 family beta-barrel protein [Bacteroidales bacterium]|nr:DUF5777 family beta-barrel protein [Bacteroidales bacterium]
MIHKILFLQLVLLCGCLVSSFSQPGSEHKMDERMGEIKKDKTVDAFGSSRLIYGRSAQTTRAGNLDLRISHRFGRLREGIDDWFGLDTAFVRIGLDYGITDRLMVGFGRSKMDKELDLSVAYKMLEQSETMPVTLSLYGGVMVNTLKMSGQDYDFGDRLSTIFQVLVARRFLDRFTIQVAPVWVYNDRVPTADDDHHIFSVGLGGQVRILKRLSMNVEYYPVFSGSKYHGTVSPLAVGVDIQTWGHVFQFFVGNSMAPNEHLSLIRTTDKWEKGQIHFGFNLLRRFPIASKRP